jgi:hypothetical protein
MKKYLSRSFLMLATFLAFSALTACAVGGKIVEHAFTFDARTDSPDIEILDFRYGNSTQPGASNPDYLRKEGKSIQRMGTSGRMLRGESLFVKWRIKSTGQTYEDTADLRSRLPADIKDKNIYFVVKGPQLYVYLISEQPRPPHIPADGPRAYNHLVSRTIYPD